MQIITGKLRKVNVIDIEHTCKRNVLFPNIKYNIVYKFIYITYMYVYVCVPVTYFKIVYVLQ